MVERENRGPIYDVFRQMFTIVGLILFGAFISNGGFSQFRLVRGAYAEVLSTNDSLVPSMPPADVQVRSTNATTLRVSWSPPPPSSWNGELKGYHIAVLGNETQHHRYINTTARAAFVTIFHLIASMTYRVQVAAINSVGVGETHSEVFTMA